MIFLKRPWLKFIVSVVPGTLEHCRCSLNKLVQKSPHPLHKLFVIPSFSCGSPSPCLQLSIIVQSATGSTFFTFLFISFCILLGVKCSCLMLQHFSWFSTVIWFSTFSFSRHGSSSSEGLFHPFMVSWESPLSGSSHVCVQFRVFLRPLVGSTASSVWIIITSGFSHDSQACDASPYPACQLVL